MMKLIESGETIILENAKDFDLQHVFECGQCFRWNAENQNEYIGVAMSRVIHIVSNNGNIVFKNTNFADINEIWRSYFSLDTDYGNIKGHLENDEILKIAIAHGQGIRILKQDLFECIISFIISASNNIPRIKKIIESFCKEFGKPIIYQEKTYYSFPTISDLKGVSLSDLAVIKAGYRDKYIFDAVEKISTGEFDLECLQSLDAQNAKKYLMEIKGIGEKVANCVLLFGLGKYDSFPIDVWIQRVMEQYYYSGMLVKKSDIAELAKRLFGEYGGYAQQYLFFYARQKGKEFKT